MGDYLSIGFTIPMRVRATTIDRARAMDLAAFAVDPAHLDPLCTFGALMVWRQFGGEVWGYFIRDNPTAVVGASGTGHDFAIVDGRFLVDAWAGLIEGTPVPPVMDLATRVGQEWVEAWYGLPSRWGKTRGEEFRGIKVPLRRIANA